MRSFLSKHQFLVIWIAGLTIIGALTVLVIQLNNSFIGGPAGSQAGPIAPLAGTGAVPLPPAPSVSLTLQTASSGAQSLNLQWNNLPGTTDALLIYRGKGNDTSTWTLWKTIELTLGQLANGNAQFVLSKKDTGYEYYVQAVNSGGGGNGGGASTSTDVLWTSNPVAPSQGGGGNGNGSGQAPPPGSNGGGNGGTQGGGTGGQPTGTTQGGGGNGGTQGGGGTGNGPGPSGNPFYNPRIQITGYGTAPGSFWVQHVNQSIEIGWQDLPASTDGIVVSRAATSTGPWNQVLAQNNPGETGSFSITLVDGTLGDPYYYQLVAFHGTTTVATYGPIFLPATGQ